MSIDYSNWPYRQAVSAFILNEHNDLFLAKIVNVLDYEWNVPGGGIESGESPEQALYRELKEEISIDKEDLDLLFLSPVIVKYDFPEAHLLKRFKERGEKYKGQERYQYVLRYVGDPAHIKVDNKEFSGFEWVSLENLDKYYNLQRMLENAKQVLSGFISKPY